MAKMFYTMDETKAALGKSEEDIKQLARDGRLREFRDGPRLMFKADQVEALKGEAGAADTADQVGLGAGDTHTPLGIMDSKTGSGTDVAMNVEQSKDDTGGMDVGLSGSLSGSIGGGSLAGGTGIGQTRTPGKQGVNVFGEGEGDADPMAQTHMSAPKDQISLEGVGSGSGLLDLTRETDDTSLGAALLDEISPGGKRTSPTPAAGSSSSGSTAGMTSISSMDLPPETVASAAPIYGSPVMVEANDPVAPAFGAMSIAAILVLLFAGFVVINAVVVDSPMVSVGVDMLKGENTPYIFLGVGVVLAIILFFAGMMAGKNRATA